jgi:hypothetical protein
MDWAAEIAALEAAAAAAPEASVAAPPVEVVSTAEVAVAAQLGEEDRALVRAFVKSVKREDARALSQEISEQVETTTGYPLV